jgi:pyruvate dehydrogenase E1 component
VDSDLLFSYREAKDGQLLEEGITEAGAMGSFMAAGTSYATHGEPMIPFYMFYSMFGFQRTGDQAWAVGDARGRGFLIGATAGRTTLNGEGLQHQDGHSHVLASTVPCCVQYDPAFHFEIATIVRDGLRRMYEQGEDVFYYITVYNENYAMPAMPRGVEEGILRGLYLFKPCLDAKRHIVQIFGSGALMMQALEAQRILAERYDVAADVWSATSYRALRDDALQTEAWNLAHPLEKPRVPYLQKVLANAEGPIIAVSDYMKAWPDSIARWVRQPFLPLGTDGFGMSDTREQLRRHFKVDAASIVYAALYKLAEMGKLGFDEVARAGAELYGEAAVPEPVAGR